MNLEEFLKHLNSKKPVPSGSELHKFMTKLSNEAMKISAEMNSSYHDPE